LTFELFIVYVRPSNFGAPGQRVFRFGQRATTFPAVGPQTGKTMKIRNSLKALKGRHRANRMVRRKGRIYIINKSNPRFKARQG